MFHKDKTKEQIEKMIKEHYGRSMISLREMCMFGGLNYGMISTKRPKYIYKHAHKIGNSILFENHIAAKIIKRSSEF